MLYERKFGTYNFKKICTVCSVILRRLPRHLDKLSPACLVSSRAEGRGGGIVRFFELFYKYFSPQVLYTNTDIVSHKELNFSNNCKLYKNIINICI